MTLRSVGPDVVEFVTDRPLPATGVEPVGPGLFAVALLGMGLTLVLVRPRHQPV